MMRSRNARFYSTVGRLKEGVAPATALADLAAVQAQLSAEFPASDAGWSVYLEPLKEQAVGGVRKSLWILFGAVSLVLLIACSNVACLLLAQASRREREIAVRFSLGARRAQVVGGLLREAVCAALPGAVLGLAIAVAGGRWFRTAAAGLPRADEIQPDWRIVAFTFAATIATAITFGLLPALQATRERLAQGGRTVVGGGQRLLRALVATQIALAIVLLVGAGLLIRTMERIGQLSLGFNPDQVLTLRVSASWSERGPLVAQRLARTLEALAAIPGVTSAALTVSVPGTGEVYPSPIGIPGQDSSQTFADLQAVSPDYFRTLQIPMLMGETCRLTTETLAVNPALVNRTFVDRYLSNQKPLGLHLKLPNSDVEIIGVVSDVREHGYANAPEPVIYTCGAPWFFPHPTFMVRTAGDPSMLTEAVRRRMQQVDPNRAVYDIKPLAAHLSESLGAKRFQTTLLSLFGATALLLAAVGLYGVTSFFVSQRRREIGLRAALGAQPVQILTHVFRQGGLTAAAGLSVGLAAAAVVTRWLSTLLFGVGPLDPVTFVLAPMLLALVASVALWIPAHRAARVDPMDALREE
jgi:putative ABC transport system permease protein